MQRCFCYLKTEYDVADVRLLKASSGTGCGAMAIFGDLAPVIAIIGQGTILWYLARIVRLEVNEPLARPTHHKSSSAYSLSYHHSRLSEISFTARPHYHVCYLVGDGEGLYTLCTAHNTHELQMPLRRQLHTWRCEWSPTCQPGILGRHHQTWASTPDSLSIVVRKAA